MSRADDMLSEVFALDAEIIDRLERLSHPVWLVPTAEWHEPCKIPRSYWYYRGEWIPMEAVMATCKACNQVIPQPQFKAGDFVQTTRGEIGIVPDDYLRGALDARYGGPLFEDGIRLISPKGHSFIARRDSLTVVHGFIRFTERV